MGEAELSPDIERLAKKWEKDPSSKVFAQLGDLYRKAKLYDESIQILTKGLEANPSYAPGHLVLAKTYLDQMRSAMAKEELDKVVELDPQNIVALRLLAQIVEKGGDSRELTRIYELILSVDPSNQTISEKLDQIKKSQPKKEEAPTGEFRVETFQQFRPPDDKGKTISEVKTDLTEQMTVEPLDKKPTFAKDLPEEEEKIEIEPYVEKPGAGVESTEEIGEEELEIQRDVSFQTSTEPAEEKIETDIMGQLTGGKKVVGEEVVDEEIDLQSDLMSQMGAEVKKETEPEEVEKIDTDMMGQLTGEPTAKPEPEAGVTEKPEIEPESVQPVSAVEPEVIEEETPVAEVAEPEKKEDEISSIEDVLEVKPPEESVPTVDEILKPEENEESEEKKQEDEGKKKDNLQSFRDWLDGLTK